MYDVVECIAEIYGLLSAVAPLLLLSSLLQRLWVNAGADQVCFFDPAKKRYYKQPGGPALYFDPKTRSLQPVPTAAKKRSF